MIRTSVQTQFRRRLTGAVFACLVLTGVAGAVQAGHPAPLAQPSDRSPWTKALGAQQARALEAEVKTRALLAHKASGSAARTAATANQAAYDALYYDLVFNLDPVSKILTGTTLLRAQVLSGGLTELELDLDVGLTVAEVRSGGGPAAFSHSFGLLTVTLDQSYGVGEIVEVEVDYAGNPAGDYFGWSTYGGAPLVWTLSEPYGAREWWPCKDLNTDKPDSVALHVTVPDNLVVASNGTLDQVTVPGAGLKTYHWTERHPIATYLVSLAVHPYTVLTDIYVSALGDTMPLEYYVVPDKAAYSATKYAVVPTMMTALVGLFGEYPFLDEKYGHAHFPWGGGMEHQTCSSMSYNYFGEGLIVHELAHQWFGDLVTCADFSHIWINEGFATWSEAYWAEQVGGAAAYRSRMNELRYQGPGTIIVENPQDFSSIFVYNLTYMKASWVPHMLRHMMSEAQFTAALQQILGDFGNGSATTADVQQVFESVSGLDLTQFFQQWIYGEYYPAYEVAWQGWPEGPDTRVSVRVSQTQINTGLFTMPLDVRLTTSAGDTTFVVANNQADQWYDFVVPGTVSDVQLDPDGWVLCSVAYDGASAVPDVAPAAMRLEANVPNPFNPATQVRFSLGTTARISLDIYDVSGRLVRNLLAEQRAAGDHQVRWDGTDTAGRAVASGTYFVRLQGDGPPQMRPLTLVR